MSQIWISGRSGCFMTMTRLYLNKCNPMNDVQVVTGTLEIMYEIGVMELIITIQELRIYCPIHH